MLNNVIVNINKKLILFFCKVFSNDSCKVVYFFKFFIIFKNVMCVYSRNENNKSVVFIKIIMRCIEIKFLINENIVNNNINYKIQYVINVE